jgi:hypothetical protein
MGFADANSYLSSKGVKSSSFDNIGDTHTGTLKDVDVVTVTDTNGIVQMQKDGVTPKRQLVITWQTEERDPQIAGDDGTRKLYCSWRLESAIRANVRAAGGDGLEPDAKLTVTYSGTEKVKGAPMPAKLYEVAYERPSFGAGKVSAAPVAADYPAEKVQLARTLADAGQPVELVSQASGIPVEWLLPNVMTI